LPIQLNKEVVARLARFGAQARLEQIEAERRAILSAFPDLARLSGERPAGGLRVRRLKMTRKTKGAAAGAEGAPVAAPRRRKKRMSAAARKAVSERMKKYWAARRKEKA
jgi:hypothetical protein